MERHEYKIESYQGETGIKYFRAVCSCGHITVGSPAREWPSEAWRRAMGFGARHAELALRAALKQALK